MDTNEAREHLEMVDRILSRTEPPKNYRPWTWVFVIIGLAAALIQAGGQAAVDGHGYLAEIAGGVLMGCGYIYMIWVSYSSRRNAERISASEARIGKASSAVWLAVVIAFFAQPHIWTMWGAGAPGYALSAGFLLGYVVPGVLTLIEKDESEACG